MKEAVIELKDVGMVDKFVSDISEMNCAVDAVVDRAEVDAKSLDGMFYIFAQSVPVKIIINTDDETEIAKFAKIMEKYEVRR